ncbi:MAG: hypothetical protein CM15mP83_7460 [Flavobacteriaceae bacterium]|nr:MAG: hypothetical protein CM15mP83_7460 [Flavobacteriaceae bacterium]
MFDFIPLLCAICLQAQDVDAIFSKANKNYNLGSYKEALKGYDSIVQLGVHSPELYFNMGNAHYKLNRIAPSILNYEKAQLLDPQMRTFSTTCALPKT